MKAYGSMLSFELKGGFDAGLKLMDRVKVCVLATTLGTLDTLVQHPASMTHLPVPEAQRIAAGITNGLIRISVGIENAQDIIADLEQAMR
jgi:methionine-gamma-lyase